ALRRNALRGTHRRTVFLVNRRGEEILGQPSYRSLFDLPQPPELVAIVVRAAAFEASLDESLRAGARAIVAITAGIGEKDAPGLTLQRAMADRARAAGAGLIGPARTRAIAVYVEDFADGRAFASIAESAAAAGKPVVLLTIGETPASARVAHSHTGALVSDSIAVDAACRASGMYRVQTPQQMVDLLQVLLAPHQPAGRRVAIAGDGGG